MEKLCTNEEKKFRMQRSRCQSYQNLLFSSAKFVFFLLENLKPNYRIFIAFLSLLFLKCLLIIVNQLMEWLFDISYLTKN